MYAVVERVEDGRKVCFIISENWIKGVTICYPQKDIINKLLKENVEPEDSWQTIKDFKILKNKIGLFVFFYYSLYFYFHIFF